MQAARVYIKMGHALACPCMLLLAKNTQAEEAHNEELSIFARGMIATNDDAL
jgi:hypothetical protein